MLAGPSVGQTLPVPSSVKPTAPSPVQSTAPSTVPTQEDLDKLAAQAQKAVFDAAEKSAASSSTSGAMLPPQGVTQMPAAGAPGARITTRNGGGTFTTPAATLPRLDDPSQWPRDSVHQLAIMEISFGSRAESVVIELFPSDAPQTVANFIDLCESKFYDGLAFHRAIQNFLVQTGDPLTSDEDKREQWGTGGEERSVPAEIRRPHRIGAVAMARRGDSVNPTRKSNGSQFYISLGHFDSLDGKYSVFGQVVSGLDVLQHIAKMPVDSNDCPVARIEVGSIRVVDQKGPMSTLSGEGDKRRFRTGAASGFVGRVLERVW